MTRPHLRPETATVRGVARAAGFVRSLPRRALLAAMHAPAARWGLRLVVDLPFDPHDPAFRVDPYPAYHRLRERDPVHWSFFGSWLVTRYAEAAIVLTDHRFGHPDYRAEARRRKPDALRQLSAIAFITMNPPAHTRLRRVFGEIFTPEYVAGLRPRIQATADRLLDRVNAVRRMDAIADFASLLPVEVVAEMLDLPLLDALRCQRLSRAVADASDIGVTSLVRQRAEAGAAGLIEYFQRLILERKRHPAPGLITTLIQAQEKNRQFSDDELLGMCLLLFMAGHETASSFVGLAVHTLLRNRSAWEELQADGRLIPTAVDELLRYEPSVQLFGRQAQEDVTLAGKRIRRGQTVFVIAGAVNRDPARFSDPDRLDLRREPNHHFAFGHGIHGCIGQALGRLQGQVSLETLVRRCPGLRPDRELPVWRERFAFRALDKLPVAW